MLSGLIVGYCLVVSIIAFILMIIFNDYHKVKEYDFVYYRKVKEC